MTAAACPIALAARPRTLALRLGAAVVEAAMLGPGGAELGPRVTAPVEPTAAPGATVEALWAALEPLGEFDRISVCAGAGLAPDALAAELARQSLRPVRTAAAADLRWLPVLARRGVELVLELDAPLAGAVFVDGVAVPGLDIAALRARKRRTLGAALALEVAARKGPRGWGRRVRRAVDDLLAAFRPRALYLLGPGLAHLPPDLALPAEVTRVDEAPWLAGALALWG